MFNPKNIIRNNTAWGDLPHFPVPMAIVQSSPGSSLTRLGVNAPALTVLLLILKTAQARSKPKDTLVIVNINYKRLTERSGFSTSKISAALKELDGLYIRRKQDQERSTHGQFGSSEMFLLHPSPEYKTKSRLDSVLRYGDGKNILVAATPKIQYFLFPKPIVTEVSQPWSLPNLSSSETKVYTVACWLVKRRKDQTVYDIAVAEMGALAALSKPAFRRAIERLEELGLMQVEQNGRSLHIALCDPYTREPLHEKKAAAEGHDDPRNYLIFDNKSRSRRFITNIPDAPTARRMLQSALPDGAEINDEPNGEVKILCPYHEERTASCFVNFEKQNFICFGGSCKQQGHMNKLLMRLYGEDISKLVHAQAELLGVHVEYRDPDSEALARYTYRDRRGKLLKQVLRFEAKRFLQWKPGLNGTRQWNDIPTLLYNLQDFDHASVIVITEGEQDADSLNKLHLIANDGRSVIATTSGSSSSWQDAFADELSGKRVIILPDADDPGTRYAADISTSLRARAIEHRVITFTEGGVKDVFDYLQAGNKPEQLVHKLGADWIRVPGDRDELLEEFVGYQPI